MLWNPFRDLDISCNRLTGAGAPKTFREQQGADMPEWAPPVDVLEHPNGYVLAVELPGMRKEDVKLTVEHNKLIIEGERTQNREDQCKPIRVERAHGRFSRVFQLSEDADVGKISASMNAGLLEVRIAKREEALPKHIEVKVN